MPDTRSCIELAVPPRFYLAVASGTTFSCFDSIGTVTNVGAFEELLAVRSELAGAIVEAFDPLPRAQKESASRRLDKVSDAALCELNGQPAAKALRAISWWLSGVLSAGQIELWQGSAADHAITKLMAWNDNTFDLLRPRAVDALDASAQRQARRIGRRLTDMGYFLS